MPSPIQKTFGKTERAEYDFYSTDPKSVEALLNSPYAPDKTKLVWECACGTGAISNILEKHKYSVVNSDIVQREGVLGFMNRNFPATPFESMMKLITNCKFVDCTPQFIIDFLQDNQDFFLQEDVIKELLIPHNANYDLECTILTNPPFKLEVEFVERALELIEDGGRVYMYLKSLSIHGQERYNKLFVKGKGFKYFLPFVKRQTCYKNGDSSNSMSSAIDYAWFVWEKGYQGQVVVDHLLV